MKVVPYMSFNGNAEEALNYYKVVLEGDIGDVMRYKDAPDMDVSEGYMDKLLHGQLKIGDNEIFVADTFENMPVKMGGSVEMTLLMDSEEELRKVFDAFAKEGEVQMPVDKMFWGAIFGSVVDKFGIRWSLNFNISE